MGAIVSALVAASLATAALLAIALPALLLPGALATGLLLLLLAFSALIVLALGPHAFFLILLIGHADTPSFIAPSNTGYPPNRSKQYLFRESPCIFRQ